MSARTTATMAEGLPHTRECAPVAPTARRPPRRFIATSPWGPMLPLLTGLAPQLH
jgi:hypothetical protein